MFSSALKKILTHRVDCARARISRSKISIRNAFNANRLHSRLTIGRRRSSTESSMHCRDSLCGSSLPSRWGLGSGPMPLPQGGSQCSPARHQRDLNRASPRRFRPDALQQRFGKSPAQSSPTIARARLPPTSTMWENVDDPKIAQSWSPMSCSRARTMTEPLLRGATMAGTPDLSIYHSVPARRPGARAPFTGRPSRCRRILWLRSGWQPLRAARPGHAGECRPTGPSLELRRRPWRSRRPGRRHAVRLRPAPPWRVRPLALAALA